MEMYTFEKLCNPSRLEEEIALSSISVAFDHIETVSVPEETKVFFKAELSTEEQTILADLVSSHENTPLPDDFVQTVSISQADPDTGGLSLTPKFAPPGWHQQYFETEFQTSDSSATSIHEKNWLNQNIGFSSLKFYKLVAGVEVECTNQIDIGLNCIRTDLLWMPDHDYSIKSGFVAQKSVPASNIYVWALGVDLDAAYGGPQAVFAEGGINLQYVEARTRSGLDGVSATRMNYSHPQLGPGVGFNRIRFVVRHLAGVQHRIQAVFEIFKE